MKSKTKNFHLQYQISRPNLFDPSMLCCPNHNSKTTIPANLETNQKTSSLHANNLIWLRTTIEKKHFYPQVLLNSWNIWKHHLAIANIQKQPCTFNNQEQWWDIADQEKNKKMLSKLHNQTPHFAEVTSHLLEGNIPNKNPRTCKPQNFRCHKNSLAHSATENNDRKLQIKNKKKKILHQNFANTRPFSYWSDIPLAWR